MSVHEDFGDGRHFLGTAAHGIVLLLVWKTTLEETEQVLKRLVNEVTEDELTENP